MATYRFYPRANAAQDKIWADTANKWVETQAKTYIIGLHAHLHRLCESRILWRKLPQNLAVTAGVKREAYFSRYEHHYVFFRELDNGDVGVVHEKMDVPERLTEDLSAIDAKAVRADE